MNFKQDLTNKIKELGPKALPYFQTINPDTGKPFVEGVSRQKIAAWVRRQTFPPEAYECFAANDFEEAGGQPSVPAPQPVPVQRPRQNARPAPRNWPVDEVPGQPEPTSGLMDTDGASVHPALPGVQLAQPRRKEERFAGMSVVEPRANAGPANDQDPYLVQTIIDVLVQCGLVTPQMANPQPRTPIMDPNPPVVMSPALRRVHRRGWNNPPEPIQNAR